MEKREVIMILVIVGIFLLLNKPYTGYQSMPIPAQGSYKIYTNPIKTGDSNQPRGIISNQIDSGFNQYEDSWSKKCSNDKDCPKGFECVEYRPYSGYCTSKSPY